MTAGVTGLYPGTQELLQKDLLKLLFLRLKLFFGEVAHLNEFDFVRVLKRRINTAPIDELADFRLDFHALVIEKEIDKRLGCIRPRRFGAQVDVMTIAEHVVVAHVV